MALNSLEVRDFRCIEHAQLELDARCTVIAGANASGKTSLLEAIYFLGSGRSFRTSQSELLIRQGTEAFMVAGRVHSSGREVALGVNIGRAKSELRIAGQSARGFAELAGKLPTQVIEPGVHRLLEDGPLERRRFLDWGVFHVEPQFITAWRRYQRALRQRNAALKSKGPVASVTAWDEELVAAGELVTQHRRDYVNSVQSVLTSVVGALMGVPVAAEYRQGWPEGVSLSKALGDSLSRDQRQGATTVGPHRSDLALLVDQIPARERISRGQQKLLAAGLMLAQLSFHAAHNAERPCLLLDDPAAELDVDNLHRLLKAVAETPAQLVVTTVDFASVDSYLGGRRFHVKQGHIESML